MNTVSITVSDNFPYYIEICLLDLFTVRHGPYSFKKYARQDAKRVRKAFQLLLKKEK